MAEHLDWISVSDKKHLNQDFYFFLNAQKNPQKPKNPFSLK